MLILGRKLAMIVIAVGLVAVVIGGLFIGLGFQKSQLITDKMAEQAITYTGAGGDIQGIIDTPQEAEVMANVMSEHLKGIGNYSELPRDDPKRAQILQGMTIENSLQLAVMGSGLTDVVKGSGAFMILVGGVFALIGVSAFRNRRKEI
jgi:hypothetical protein